MTHSPALTLAPCPMCGSDKISEDFGDESACIRCRNCGCQSGRVYFTEAEKESDDFVQSEADARAAWNRRPELAASADAGKLAELQRELDATYATMESFADILDRAWKQIPGAYEPDKSDDLAECIAELAALSRPAPAVVNESLTTAPVSAQGDEVDAARLDWLRDNLFMHRWNGVIGPGWRVDWSIVPNYRHVRLFDESGNEGGDFRAAIDAARAQQGGQ